MLLKLLQVLQNDSIPPKIPPLFRKSEVTVRIFQHTIILELCGSSLPTPLNWHAIIVSAESHSEEYFVFGTIPIVWVIFNISTWSTIYDASFQTELTCSKSTLQHQKHRPRSFRSHFLLQWHYTAYSWWTRNRCNYSNSLWPLDEDIESPS